MSDNEDVFAIVIDNGSSSCKAGYAGDDFPCLAFPSLVGRTISSICTARNEIYIGDEAQKKKGIFSLKYPIEHGIITNWNDMETIWSYTFSELCDDSTKFSVLMTEAPLNPKSNRETMAQILFETYHFSAVYVSMSSVLSLLSAHHRTTGIVVELGDGVCNIVPFYEGYVLPKAITRLDFGGRDLTDYFMKLLCEKNYSFSSTSERELVRDIKEKFCYVAKDFDIEMEKPHLNIKVQESCFNMSLGNELFSCPEALFQPSLVNLKSPGIHQVINDSIMKCDVDIRKDLYMNIILSGGTSMFPGLVERMHNSISDLTQNRIKIVSPPEREFSVWLGASYLTSRSFFKKMWFTKKEYDENGPCYIHKRCF